MALEASSGQHIEKNTQSAIAILKAVTRRNLYSKFTTMTQLLTFTVQSVCRTLTLTATQFDSQASGRYIVQQHRVAGIPTTSNEMIDL